MLKRASNGKWYIYFNKKQQLILDTGVSKTKTIYILNAVIKRCEPRQT